MSEWLCRALIAIVLLIHAPPIRCQDEESSSDRLMFVPPPVDGVISLGVYDDKGKLVRVLKKAAAIDSFKSGLNGLFIDWDKNDQQGKPAPPGKYYARGVLVGDVKIAGVAFHLNDWVGNQSAPRPRKILSIALLSNSSVAILCETPQQNQILVESGPGKIKSLSPGFQAENIKTNGTNLLVYDNSQLAVIAPDTGPPPAPLKFSDIRDADACGDKLLVLSGSRIQFGLPGNLQDLPAPADNLVRCALLGSSPLVATRDSKLYKLDGNEFVPLDSGESGELLDACAGTADTIWLLIRTDSTSLLKQIDLSDRNLREIELPKELRTVGRISAARDQNALLLFSQTGDTQRVTGVRFQAVSQGKSVWEKWLDRGLTSFRYFDLKEGKVVPADNKTDSPPAFVRPANNPLENTRQANFQLVVSGEQDGEWVASVDGLPLFQVCKTRDVKQTRWISDGANGLRVYISDGSVVEEYHLTSLDNLFRFDAGSFD